MDYLKEWQPALDYSSLRKLSAALASGFWKNLERHLPGISSLRLSAQVAETGVTATCVRASLLVVAAALAALTSEPQRLPQTCWSQLSCGHSSPDCDLRRL